MYTASENVMDLDLLRRIVDESVLESFNGRYPAAVTALMRAGCIEECAVGDWAIVPVKINP